MEPDTRPPASQADDSAAGRFLAPGGHPLSRLQDHAQGLSKDVRAWLEMRFELAKIELWERVDEQADQLVLYAIVGMLGAVAGLVLLLATCFGASWIISALTGWVFGALFFGFLAVALVFFALAGLLFLVKPHFGIFEDKTRATVSEHHVMQGRAAGERVAPDGSSSK